MKKLHLLLVMVITLTTSVAMTAFAQNAKDPTSKIFINAKGGIYNHAGTKLGYIDKNNMVRDNKAKELYFIDKDGNVIGSDGRKLGKAKKNGAYYNINGENVLNTKDIDKENCAILDPQGHNLGTAHKNYKLHACAAHCYWLMKAKEKAAQKV
ncbi:5-fold beta-flower protein [Mucilaginibacter antarcticus]|uniref:5-fold beta-flower protein n=1 Tax=Mucilaginibacter antarcticus TaxID=1855725 RepID=A0ABW5XTQ5_9SPHI